MAKEGRAEISCWLAHFQIRAAKNQTTAPLSRCIFTLGRDERVARGGSVAKTRWQPTSSLMSIVATTNQTE